MAYFKYKLENYPHVTKERLARRWEIIRWVSYHYPQLNPNNKNDEKRISDLMRWYSNQKGWV